MKLYWALIISSVVMAFMAGQYTLLIKGNYRPTAVDLLQITSIKEDFFNSDKPFFTLNLDELYPSPFYYNLLDPTKTRPDPMGDWDFDSGIVQKGKNCFRPPPFSNNLSAFKKLWVWEEYKCELRKNLPKDFFEMPPYMHPNGKSFAYLAYISNKLVFNSSSWLRKNLRYFHLIELANLKSYLGIISKPYSVLIELKKEKLTQLLEGNEFIYTKNYIIRRTHGGLGNLLVNFAFHRKSRFDQFLKETPFILVPQKPQRPCFIKESDFCWNYNLKHLIKLANKTTLGLFILSILVLGSMIFALINKIKTQKFDDEKRKLALRVLTHEFRTPISSMLLEMENLQRHYESFPDEAQAPILGLKDNLYRLQRMVEKSRQYLRANQDKRLIQFQLSEHSINEIVEDTISTFDQHKIVWEPLKDDPTIRTDAYWVSICLRNLVENAIHHGLPPVTVDVQIKDTGININVSDHGDVPLPPLNDMKVPFSKGIKSSGSGLGLNIVFQVAKELGGHLSIKRNPNTFTIYVKNKRLT